MLAQKGGFILAFPLSCMDPLRLISRRGPAGEPLRTSYERFDPSAGPPAFIRPLPSVSWAGATAAREACVCP